MSKVFGDEQVQRAAIVAEALTWCGTAYHSEGEVKCVRDHTGKVINAGGVDCGKLIYCIYRNAGLIPARQFEHYPPDWHLHRSEEKYLSYVMPWAREITREESRPADVVLYKYGRTFSHGAVIIEPGWPYVVHAKYDARCVLADQGDTGRQAKYERRFFTYW